MLSSCRTVIRHDDLVTPDRERGREGGSEGERERERGREGREREREREGEREREREREGERENSNVSDHHTKIFDFKKGTLTCKKVVKLFIESGQEFFFRIF